MIFLCLTMFIGGCFVREGPLSTWYPFIQGMVSLAALLWLFGSSILTARSLTANIGGVAPLVSDATCSVPWTPVYRGIWEVLSISTTQFLFV